MNPFAALVGAFYPANLVAEKIFRQTLLGAGLDPAAYPISELAVRSVSLAKFKGGMQREWYRLHLYDAACGIAYAVVYITRGDSSWSAREIRRGIDSGTPDDTWEILAKHDPERFSLDALEQTQAPYAKRQAAG
jgi:hypothetical protein